MNDLPDSMGRRCSCTSSPRYLMVAAREAHSAIAFRAQQSAEGDQKDDCFCWSDWARRGLFVRYECMLDSIFRSFFAEHDGSNIREPVVDTCPDACTDQLANGVADALVIASNRS